MIELELTYRAVCCHEPEDCGVEYPFFKLIHPKQMTVEIGSFRLAVLNALITAGWALDAEGGWLCPRHSSPVTRHSQKEAA